MSDLCLSFSYIKSFLPLTDPWDACLSCWYWKLPASSSCWLLFWDLKEKLFFAPLSFSLSFYQLSSFGLVSMYISLFQFSAFQFFCYFDCAGSGRREFISMGFFRVSWDICACYFCLHVILHRSVHQSCK